MIGARCAGAATATLLARAGLDVLLVDRASLPSEIPHGHFIHRHGPQRLARWGLLEPALGDRCRPVTAATLDFGELALSADGLEVDGVPMGLGPRHGRLDAVLCDAAVEAGAELRPGFAVADLLRDGDRVTGVQARDGTREHAGVVIGADGRNSHVARLAGAPVVEDGGSLSCWYFSYWSGVESNALEISVRDHTALFAFPTDDDLLGLFVAWPLSELRRVKADVEGAVMAAVDAVPFLGERVRVGRREERFYGATQLPNIIRRPYGPGWALAGDAACHKDPFLALGVCDALRDAELLAEAIPSALEDGDLDAALERYGAAHEAATRPDFEENLRAARLDGLDDRAAALFAALRGRDEDTRDFFLAREGMIDPASFFTPARLGPILAG